MDSNGVMHNLRSGNEGTHRLSQWYGRKYGMSLSLKQEQIYYIVKTTGKKREHSF